MSVFTVTTVSQAITPLQVGELAYPDPDSDQRWKVDPAYPEYFIDEDNQMYSLVANNLGCRIPGAKGVT
jgi:hypothetical protein